MKYHLTLVTMAIFIKFTNNKCSRECEEKGTLPHCWWEYKLVAATMENSLELPQKTKNRVNSAILLLLSHFSRVRLCATPQTAAHQAPPSLGFSRQEHWSGLPLPSPMHESEQWKWSRSVMPDSSWPHGLQPTRLLRPWDFPGKSTGVGCLGLVNLQIMHKWIHILLKQQF